MKVIAMNETGSNDSEGPRHEPYPGPENYFDGGVFVPRRLANHILGRLPRIITLDDTKEMLMYGPEEGLYFPAESEIEAEIDRALSERREIRYIRETLAAIQTSTYIKRSILNKDLHLIHLKNGIYDLEANTLRPFRSDVISIVQIPIIYDKKASCPNIMKFMKEVVIAGDINVVQEWFGYLLYKGYPIQVALMLLGEGANGKSTLLGLMREFVGRFNVSSVPLQDFGHNRFAEAQLYGKFANICGDLSNKAVEDTSVFKMLTGGDPIYAEHKFKPPFSFVNYAKLTFSCNQIPETKDDSDAYHRRWMILDFSNKFEEEKADKNLLNKFKTPEELSGLFNWAVEGLKRLLENGGFSNGVSTKEKKVYYLRKSSPVKAFLTDCIEYDSESEVLKDAVYDEFFRYCRKHGVLAPKKGEFSSKLKKLAELIDESKVGRANNRVWAWRGIRLKVPSEQVQLTIDDVDEDVQYVQDGHPNPTSTSL